MTSDCGRNAQQIVSYRDISNRAVKGNWARVPHRGTRQETHMCTRRGRARASATNMVNPKLRHCALEWRCWGRERFRPAVGRHISTVPVETAAFLQQVPTTVEWGPLSRWN